MSATHVFISHSSANNSFVQRLVADLKRNGITVWVDQSSLTPGTTDWETALRNAIGKAHAVILIASEEARKSPYVKDELRLAHDIHHLPIYPLWVAGNQWINCIPLGWGGAQYIDARGGEAQYQAALHQLRAALSGVKPVTSLLPTLILSHPSTPIVQPTPQPPISPGYRPYARPRLSQKTLGVILLIMVLCSMAVVGTVVAIQRIPTALSTATTPTPATATTPTPAPVNLTVSPQTLTALSGSSKTCVYLPDIGSTCDIQLQNNGQNTIQWHATSSSNLATFRPSSAGSLSAGKSWTLTVYIAFSAGRGPIYITITPDGGAPQTVKWSYS